MKNFQSSRYDEEVKFRILTLGPKVRKLNSSDSNLVTELRPTIRLSPNVTLRTLILFDRMIKKQILVILNSSKASQSNVAFTPRLKPVFIVAGYKHFNV